MIIEKTIKTSEIDESIKQKIISYWESRDIEFYDISDNEYTGKRGSLIGNLTSFKMNKLLTNINIKLNDDEINCKLDINTKHQMITKYNKEFWDLELKTFENILLNNNSLEDEWKKYNKKSKKMDVIWMVGISVFTFIIINNILKKVI